MTSMRQSPSFLTMATLGISLILTRPLSSIETLDNGRALLIGCTQYIHLDSTYWLKGPANDAALMKELLTSKTFNISPDQITTLAGWPEDPQSRPTRANIERAFKRLAEDAGPDDQILIMMAGHGSQQPANEDPEDLEPDGLDEIFLPADVKGWNGETGQVENAITDDEIKIWLTAIRNKGAFVWAIFDACHSGTMTRGAPKEEERERRLPAETLVPRDVLAAAKKNAPQSAKTRGEYIPTEQILDLSSSAGNIVAMYAAQSTELAPELRLPAGSSSYHGLFTYTLNEILRQSTSPLTYQELIDRINTRFRSLGRSHPTPQIEGNGQNREVLGIKEWPDRPAMLLGEEIADGEFELKAGNLQGLSPGTILAVYPPAGAQNADRQIGHVRILKTKPLKSSVTSIAYENLPAPAVDKLIPDSRCDIVFVDYGDMRLKIAVQSQNEETLELGKGPSSIETALENLDKQTASLIERVPTATSADWFIRQVNNQSLLIPSSGWIRTLHAEQEAPDAPPSFVLGSTDDNTTLAKNLNMTLFSIARASHLMHLASGNVKRSKTAVNVNIELIRFKDPNDIQGTPVSYGPNGRMLHPGDEIAFRITNPSAQTIDISLLFIDSGYGIQAVFPLPGTLEDNRLKPGQIIDTPRFEAESGSDGPEQVVAIAVKAGPRPVDFSVLEQPTLERTSLRSASALETPLGGLLQSALYGKGATRGIGSRHLNNYAVRLLSWQTSK